MTSWLSMPIGQGVYGLLSAAEKPAPGQPADVRQVLIWLLVAMGAICAVGIVLTIANGIANRWRYNSHPALFHRLCQVHELDSASRRLLKRVARFHRLRQPARLFVEPKWLDPGPLGAALGHRAAELAQLRNRLFDGRA